jgi:hypothetical protein
MRGGTAASSVSFEEGAAWDADYSTIDFINHHQGGLPMATKTRKAASVAPSAAEATTEAAPAIKLAPEHAPAGEASGEPTTARRPRKTAREGEDGNPAYAADPHEKISVSLSDVPGGPEMQLLRSHKYKQMQIRFNKGQPDERYLDILKQAGWRDRTQEEGIWTKQIDPNGRWQSVAKMEQEFKDVANAIRADKGLGPVLEGLGA